MKVTARDVAKKAGVSVATVSYVINNGPRPVTEGTRQKVLDAIRELGYRPNRIARGLTLNRTETIGVVVSNIANNFIGEVIRGIDSVLRPNNYSIFVCNTDEEIELERHFLNLLLGQRVDGIIAAATSRQWDVLGVAEEIHTPIVFVDRKFDGLAGPFVGVDNLKGAYQGVEHLVKCGHQRIGMIAGYPRLSSIQERQRGFHQAMADNGLSVDPEWIIESSLTVDDARLAARRILSAQTPPTALFANTNLLALGTLLGIKDIGLKCPDDVALIAFDDHPWAEVCDPPLTVIRQPAMKIGQEAAKLLLKRIDGSETENTQVILPSELVIRNSCAGPTRPSERK